MLKALRKISVADVITISNGFCAIVAITFAIDGQLLIACILLWLCSILDGLDGMFARIFGTKHNYGRYLDSMSDVVAFCIAPGILVYQTFIEVQPDGAVESSIYNYNNFFVMIAVVLYIGFGAFRLVKFSFDGYKHKDFFGIPSPVAALMVIFTVYFHVLASTDVISTPLLSYLELNPVCLAIVIICAFLMVSDIVYIKTKGLIGVFVGAVIVSVLIAATLTEFSSIGERANYIPQIIGFGCTILYVVINPVLDIGNATEKGYWSRRKVKRKVRRQKRSARRKRRELRMEAGEGPIRASLPQNLYGFELDRPRRIGIQRPAWRMSRQDRIEEEVSSVLDEIEDALDDE